MRTYRVIKLPTTNLEPGDEYFVGSLNSDECKLYKVDNDEVPRFVRGTTDEERAIINSFTLEEIDKLKGLYPNEQIDEFLSNLNIRIDDVVDSLTTYIDDSVSTLEGKIPSKILSTVGTNLHIEGDKIVAGVEPDPSLDGTYVGFSATSKGLSDSKTFKGLYIHQGTGPNPQTEIIGRSKNIKFATKDDTDTTDVSRLLINDTTTELRGAGDVYLSKGGANGKPPKMAFNIGNSDIEGLLAAGIVNVEEGRYILKVLESGMTYFPKLTDIIEDKPASSSILFSHYNDVRAPYMELTYVQDGDAPGGDGDYTVARFWANGGAVGAWRNLAGIMRNGGDMYIDSDGGVMIGSRTSTNNLSLTTENTRTTQLKSFTLTAGEQSGLFYDVDTHVLNLIDSERLDKFVPSFGDIKSYLTETGGAFIDDSGRFRVGQRILHQGADWNNGDYIYFGERDVELDRFQGFMYSSTFGVTNTTISGKNVFIDGDDVSFLGTTLYFEDPTGENLMIMDTVDTKSLTSRIPIMYGLYGESVPLTSDTLIPKSYVDNNFTNTTQLNTLLQSKLEESNLDGFVNDVEYDSTNQTITFTRQNESDVVVNLQLESLITNVSLDDDNNLIIEFEGGDTQTIPLNTLLVGVVKSVNGKTADNSGAVIITVDDISGLTTTLNNKADRSEIPDVSDFVTNGDLSTIVASKVNLDGGNATGNLLSAITNNHTHSNKTILDATTASYTTADKTKLAGIAVNADVSVNSDWNATSGKAQILNLPSAFNPIAHTHALSDISDFNNLVGVGSNLSLVDGVLYLGEGYNGVSSSPIEIVKPNILNSTKLLLTDYGLEYGYYNALNAKVVGNVSLSQTTGFLVEVGDISTSNSWTLKVKGGFSVSYINSTRILATPTYLDLLTVSSISGSVNTDINITPSSGKKVLIQRASEYSTTDWDNPEILLPNRFTPKSYVDTKVSSTPDNYSPIQTIWSGTQVEYDALTIKDENTMYVISNL